MRLVTESGQEFYVNPDHVVEVWPTFSDDICEITLTGGGERRVKGHVKVVGLTLMAE